MKKILRYFTDREYRFVVNAYRGLYNSMDDEEYIKCLFEALLGYKLNLEEPRTFNEKLQWLKLHDRNKELSRYVDKYEVKNYISNLIGEEYVIRTIGVWDTFEDIDFSSFPNQFVIKTTHDSGGVIICKDKLEFNCLEAKKIINLSLKKNYYLQGREWPYKNVRPRIIAEELIIDKKHNDLMDYKLFLFNCRVKYIQVDIDRFTNHQRNFYTTEWKYVPFTTKYPTNPNINIEKPANLQEMISIANTIAEDIGKKDFLRVDLYCVENRVYFGEITFYHGSGFEKFYPDEWDSILGSSISIS